MEVGSGAKSMGSAGGSLKTAAGGNVTHEKGGGKGPRLHPQQILAFGRPCEAPDAKEAWEGGKAAEVECGAQHDALITMRGAGVKCVAHAPLYSGAGVRAATKEPAAKGTAMEGAAAKEHAAKGADVEGGAVESVAATPWQIQARCTSQHPITSEFL